MGITGLLELVSGLSKGGIFLFCGGLYARILSGRSWVAPATPVGGLMFPLAWLTIAWAVG